MGPGCVKTCASGEVAELFSSFPSLGDLCQICSSPIHRNREKASMHESDAGVFTQPGPRADILAELGYGLRRLNKRTSVNQTRVSAKGPMSDVAKNLMVL